MLSIFLLNTQHFYYMYFYLNKIIFLKFNIKNKLNLQILNKNINNSYKCIINAKNNNTQIVKYLPPYFKEWKISNYFYNKNTIKNMPININNIQKIIESYFNLFLKNYVYYSYWKRSGLHFSSKKNYTFFKQIYISKPEIKFTNSVAIITIYTVNVKNILFKKLMNYSHYFIEKKEWKNLYQDRKKRWAKIKPFSLRKIFFNKYLSFVGLKRITMNNLTLEPISKNKKSYKKNIFSTKDKYNTIYSFNKNFNETNNFFSFKDIMQFKLNILNKSLESYNTSREIIFSREIENIYFRYLKLLYRYNQEFFSNSIKFNKENSFISILRGKLSTIVNKKIELNIINLKSIGYNADIFTKVLANKFKRNNINVVWNMLAIINKARVKLENLNTKLKRKFAQSKKNNDLKLTNLMAILNKNDKNILHKKLSKKIIIKDYTNIYNALFNSIKYKNIGGIRISVKGRLTRRYRADRAVYKLFWKGGLKNLDSSYVGLPSTTVRGHLQSNLMYSMTKSKRRIGAYAVKGWIN